MMLHVVDAKYLGCHRVYLRFNNGVEGEVDLSESLEGLVFEPLRNIDFFSQFILVGHTLSWANGADFAPEFLWDLMSSQVIAQRIMPGNANLAKQRS
jgi:hypothetical protein